MVLTDFVASVQFAGPLYMMAKSNSVVPPGEYIKCLWVQLQHSIYIDIAWYIVWSSCGPLCLNMMSRTHIALSSEKDRATAAVNMYRKFYELLTWGFFEIFKWADKHAKHWSQYLPVAAK